MSRSFLYHIFQVLNVLCFTRPRYQVSVYRTIGPLVLVLLLFVCFVLFCCCSLFCLVLLLFVCFL